MGSDRPDESFAALFEQSRNVPRAKAPRVGDVLDAVVVQVGKDAVFVELDGRRQGFIEAIDLEDKDGVVKATVGETLRARVVRIDEQGVRLAPTIEAAVAAGASVSLGAKGDGDAPKVALGQVVSGTIERIENYGLFLQLDGTTGRTGRGLLPVAEMGTPRGADLRKMFPLGTKLKAKVVGLEEGKMRLSLKAMKEDEERAEFDGFKQKEQKAPEQAAGFGTLGDLLKKKVTKK
jgi:small subunit ribosomal protein S1